MITNLFPGRLGRPLAALGLLLATAGAAQAQTAPTFAPVALYSMGGNPVGPQLVDINGDGFRDLLTANYNNSTLGVRLGTGTGTLGALATFPCGGQPLGLTVGDVNNDSKLDVVLANYSNSRVSVLLGNGTGGFGAATQFATGSLPYGVALGDFNGDGKLDAVTADYGSSKVGMLLGTGTGAFGAVVEYAAGGAANAVAVGDVSGDGQLDVVVSNNNGSVGVLLGTGSLGTATVYSLGTNSSRGVALGDLNRDGRPDIVAAGNSATPVAVLLNTGAGAFGAASRYTGGTGDAIGVALGDVNSDGLLDVAVARNGRNAVEVWPGTGTGTLGTASSFTTDTNSPQDVAIGDLNNDDKPELVAGEGNSSGSLLNAKLFLNATILTAPTLTSISPNPATVGTSVTLTGTNLGGATVVSFNGTAATTFTVVNATTTTATVPSGATSGNVTVTTPGGTSNGVAFTVASAPTVTTADATNVSTTSATLGGTVTSDGGALVTERGVVYSNTNPAPTIGGSNVTRDVNGTTGPGAFSKAISGLTPGTSYSVAAYATNAANTSYGPVKTFTTRPNAPVLNTPVNGALLTTRAPVYTGTAQAGSTVRIYRNPVGQPILISNDVIANAQGEFNFTTPGNDPEGVYTVYAVAIINGVTSANSNVNRFTIDATAPTPTLSTTSSSPTSTAPIPFSVSFSETVTGFSASGIAVTNGTVTSSAVSGSGPYSFTVTPTTSGTVTVSIRASAAQDAAGNGNLASNSVSVQYTAPITATTWTGTVSSDWFTAGNWTAGVPTATVDATINASAPFQPAIGSGTASTRNLTLNFGSQLSMSGGTLDVRANLTNNGTLQPSGGTVVLGTTAQSNGPNILGSGRARFWNLTVNAGGLVLSTSIGASVRRVLTLNGTFTTQSNDFVLESDATGTALVVNNGTTGFVLGTATVQRYIDPSKNAGLGYRHYSTPVSQATVNSLATTPSGGSFTPVVNPAYNAAPAPGNVTPYPTVFGYDEQRVNLSNNLSAFDKGYVSPTSLSDPLMLGRGYSVNIGASELVNFRGPLNNGTQTVQLTSTRDTNPGGGWQLLGNPYPAPLDLSLIAAEDRAGLDAATYIYSSSSQYGGQYRSYVNNTGTGNPVVPVAQGFFMRVSPGRTAASLTFRNSQRLTTFNNTAFQRPAEVRPLVQLTLQGAGSDLTDETTVYFEQGATAAVEPRYDAVKLPNPSGLNLASRAGTEQLAIAGQEPLGTAPRVLPLVVEVPAPGSYTLSASQLLNLSGVPVYLRDLRSGAVVDLAQQPSYAFTASSSAALAGRFELVFSPQQALATAPAALAEQVGLYPNPASSQVALTLPATLGRQAATATLVDALGRTVRTLALPAQGAAPHQLDLRTLPSGIYALRLSTSAGVVVKKLTVE